MTSLYMYYASCFVFVEHSVYHEPISVLIKIYIIEQVDDEKFLRQRELFWAHKLDTLYPNGLNQREIYAAY